jgi:xanthine dehydrogenase accessory factor
VVLATVVGTSRSVPRHAGAKMLIRADGSTVGTIGGGAETPQEIAVSIIGEIIANRRAGGDG